MTAAVLSNNVMDQMTEKVNDIGQVATAQRIKVARGQKPLTPETQAALDAAKTDQQEAVKRGVETLMNLLRRIWEWLLRVISAVLGRQEQEKEGEGKDSESKAEGEKKEEGEGKGTESKNDGNQKESTAKEGSASTLGNGLAVAPEGTQMNDAPQTEYGANTMNSMSAAETINPGSAFNGLSPELKALANGPAAQDIAELRRSAFEQLEQLRQQDPAKSAQVAEALVKIFSKTRDALDSDPQLRERVGEMLRRGDYDNAWLVSSEPAVREMVDEFSLLSRHVKTQIKEHLMEYGKPEQEALADAQLIMQVPPQDLASVRPDLVEAMEHFKASPAAQTYSNFLTLSQILGVYQNEKAVNDIKHGDARQAAGANGQYEAPQQPGPKAFRGKRDFKDFDIGDAQDVDFRDDIGPGRPRG